MTPKALIFDVDGTLAETERDGHRVAFNQAFAAAGLSWHWSIDLYGELLEIPGGKERIRYYLEHLAPDQKADTAPSPSGSLAGRSIDTSIDRAPNVPQTPEALNPWIAQLHRDKSDRYSQILRQGHIAPRPGVRRLIQEARSAGVRLAIATTSALPNALAVLETILAPEAPTWFDVIAAGDIVAAKKPNPAIYHYVLEQLQLQPQDCCVFEDSAQGVRAAIAAGLPTIATVNGYTRHHDLSGATWVLSDLGEPDRPCTVIRGDLAAPHYVDLQRLGFKRFQD